MNLQEVENTKRSAARPSTLLRCPLIFNFFSNTKCLSLISIDIFDIGLGSYIDTEHSFKLYGHALD